MMNIVDQRPWYIFKYVNTYALKYFFFIYNLFKYNNL